MRKLIPVEILSIYKKNGQQVNLPSRMALATPDMALAIFDIKRDVEAEGGQLILSDLFRTHDMQHQAHLSYLRDQADKTKNQKQKRAYSPPAGSGMHEAGRAMDIDVNAIKIPLARFWQIAAKYGVKPIIPKPSKGLKECWHFDKRGSHDVVYKYYSLLANRNMKAYQAMAVSAILDIGIDVDTSQLGDQDFLRGRNKEAYIQSCLIRLGYDIGNIDGSIGPRTQEALANALGHKISLVDGSIEQYTSEIMLIVMKAFPEEY